ncbi:ABCB1-like protein [Mya arenaria]|uniref:ABCB1-like protein n=1 Tax=Mya arenaria TaxID=6604 RepID=A0ABY7E595_MYAAR|nr:ABCB1-like protein [Mya arenaria]
MMAESLNGEGTMAMPGQGQKTSYTLPAMRYVNIVLTVVFIDGIASVVLWLAGGDSDYFIDSVASFQFKKSVFDLVLLAFLKVSVHAPSIAYLEAIAIQQIDYPYNPRQKTIASLINAVNILISLGGLAFSVTKGSLVLYSVLHDSGYVHMHATYNALLVCAVVLSLIETGLILYSFQAMRRLKHLFNDDGVEVDKEGNPVKKAVSIKRLVSLAKPEFPMLLGGTLSLFFSSGTQIVAPLYFGKVVDAAQHSMDELNRTILILLVIYVGGSLFSMARSWLFTLAGQRVVARLRKHLFMSIMIGSLVLMFSLNASLTGVLLSVVPIVSLSAVQYGKFMKKLRQQFQDRLGDAGTQAEESLSSIRTVRTFSAEHKVANLYGADVDKSYQVGKKLAAAGGIFEGGVGMMVAGSIVLVLWYGGKLVHENYQNPGSGVTPGIFTSFLLYTLQVAMAFALMSALYGDFMQAVGASVRIFDLMDRKPKVPNEKGEILAQLDGRIEFKSVDFTYPSRPESKVITNLCLTVEPGEMVALVGPSGGGKSTIVNLIERFYDPDDGYITLGGQDLRDLDPMWFRQKISMVSQEPTLFACSIKDNIAYGRQATLEEVISVAMEANAHEFISSFEEGYETKVGERGVRLSGGQKQRIAIARALIMDPTILLLDEATSALDAESEHLVQEAIDRAMKGRTVVVIAHRLSTVRNASKVVVIDKGVIGEQGTHEELIRKGGVYKRLVLRQLEAGSVVDDLINLEPQSNECPQKTAPLTG